MTEATVEEIQEFDRLRFKAAQLHMFTWCVKNQNPRPTYSLRGQECCNCPEYILRGGICDPL